MADIERENHFDDMFNRLPQITEQVTEQVDITCAMLRVISLILMKEYKETNPERYFQIKFMMEGVKKSLKFLAEEMEKEQPV